jgi:hypothetical protein
VSDRSGKDLQLMSYVASLGRDAAVANLNLYVLHIDSGFLEAFSAENRTISDTLYRDLSIMRSGLETIAGASGGSLARVVAGADFAFERILRETAAAYLVGVEPVEGDRDGKPHRISVKVRIPGAQVRSRSEFAMPKADVTPATPEEALAAAYRSDRPQTAVPVRVATHVLAMGPDGRHRVLVSADIGANIESPAELRVLYAFVDSAGKAQPAVGQKVMLRPRAGGPPGSVSYTSENALPPGSYTLRFAVLDSQGRTGAVEHPVSAGLTARGDVLLSDLVLLEPVVLAGEDTYVCTDAELRSPAVDMYLEIVPAAQQAVVTDVTFSVADTPGGEPLVSATAMLARPPGAVHWSATARLKLAELPPGNYIATASRTESA